jgi:ubiquinone/menaquinone biosynthesis C-methylase UbiE
MSADGETTGSYPQQPSKADTIFDRLTQGDEIPQLVRMYEAVLVPGLESWTRELLERTGVKAGDRVLDVGCGTGIVARRAVPIVGLGGRVVGIDPTPPMLAMARAAAANEGLAIEWHQGSATKLPFPDHSFDVVLSQQVLQFIPDKSAAVREMHRVLADGGHVGIAVWQPIEHQPVFLAMHEAVVEHLQMENVAQPFAFGTA